MYLLGQDPDHGIYTKVQFTGTSSNQLAPHLTHAGKWARDIWFMFMGQAKQGSKPAAQSAKAFNPNTGFKIDKNGGRPLAIKVNVWF